MSYRAKSRQRHRICPLSSRKSFTKQTLSSGKNVTGNLIDVEADRGTPYDISQPEREALKSFSQPSTNGPYVSRKVVTEAIVEHNKPGRLPPPEETAAIEQTGEILKRGSVHLDVVINAFLDLDTVFPSRATAQQRHIQMGFSRSLWPLPTMNGGVDHRSNAED
ncbi:hypothetical protein HO173_007607 [Letharia columbiana]|uniref:Uncharacterized protein n=1 Tax=Letharia columbiana TaxID=112416 RepID=A0A8H6FT06_9LECA|nr:uncharacterized protein HO173_007607 [Letharia columbiana]KAF6234187.1 hypothetical protein HO173_007607 [Letharia columbiana]